MAKFEFPVKFHRFTTDEFDLKKAEYNAKYGYTVNIPGFRDIFKIGIDKPPTEKELSQYKSDKPGELGLHRWLEIKGIKQKKKESFLRMMSSPSPTWMQNIGTAMTFLDDVNDTLGTLAVVARFAAHMLPKTLGKVLLGPAGWALMGADIANIGMTLSRLPLKAVNLKSNLHKGLGLNPFSKKARVARAAKLKRVSLSKGELIEGLQTTDNIFGVGLCLGPIIGLAQDIIFGTYRFYAGKKVRITGFMPELGSYEKQALKYMKASGQLWTGGQELSDEDHSKSILAYNAATQVAYPLINVWHPVDNISNVNDIEIQAPIPTDPTTLELFANERIDPRRHRGFLHVDREFASPIDLWDSAEPLIDNSFHEYCDRNKHNQQGYMTAQTAVESIQNMFSLMEGEDQVELDYSFTEKAIHKMFDNGWRFHDRTTPESLSCFAETCERWGAEGFEPTWKDIRYRIFDICRVRFTRAVPK
ncbi:hypothetical protein ES703_10716 [subsurface metagenome]